MISQLAQRLSQELQDAIPFISGLIPKKELQIGLQAALSKMNLVTREEFDAQTAVLQRTRQKLEALELRCAEMEQSLNKSAE
ncbi:accessory factor UbiK family protein [Cellvibrio sp.]|uniref:accessory factor UbiK family protein n=1 Tax=Cellvibrio sp. TaxID=1965322 RepID=UPI00396484E0